MTYKPKKAVSIYPDSLRQLSFDQNNLASQNSFLKYLFVLTEVGTLRN